MSARRVVTVLLWLQAAAAVVVLALGLVVVVSSAVREDSPGSFADLALAAGVVIAVIGAVVTGLLAVALRAWQRSAESDDPKHRTTVVMVQLVLIGATAFFGFAPTRPWLWPLGVSALAVVAVLGRARPVAQQ